MPLTVRQIILGWIAANKPDRIANSSMENVAQHGKKNLDIYHNVGTYEREFRRMRNDQPIHFKSSVNEFLVRFTLLENHESQQNVYEVIYESA